MIFFRDQATEDIFNGVNTKEARKACPRTLWQIAARKLDQVDSAQSLNDLKSLRAIGLKRFPATEKANIASESTSNIESAFGGVHQGRTTLQQQIITNVRYVMVRIPTNRKPTHPGEMLREEFLSPMKISERELADAIHVPYQYISELINTKCGVTPSAALRLSKFFGVSPDFWLSLQVRWDFLWRKP